jgi:glycosyltransferase involved in cell wall biosynthesis
MAKAGVNTVRTYTLPAADVLDAAEEHGLGLMVGLQYHDWRMEPHTDRAARQRIADAGRSAVDRALELCSDRRCVFAIAIGNEVPADLVRVHGRRHVEHTLSELVARVQEGGSDLLATYVNFPTTEFLEVEGQDLVCFNVFLERPDSLRRYLRHLQVIAGGKPLVLTELGLASGIHGKTVQADSIAWQLGLAAETGCAGACVFSWTDEWAVNDHPIEGWGFGLTTVDREAKPALEAFSAWARSSIRDLRADWPALSVIVCAHNEERTIEECLESLAGTDYPNLDVIVCVDGSTDRTTEVASRFPFRILELPHGGLSRARNRGLEAAEGEIVAYLDADAACHPHWPYYLALSLQDPGVAATGGPNLPFADAGVVEHAVAHSPGDPVEVLVGDDRAEHVPGCNMAFRADALRAIGGFNVACTAAGDDVDVCWRLLDRHQQIAFSPAAQVRHHRRNSVRRYLQQQIGYGRAEKMLSGAHPHRFNGLGQAKWTGFVYTKARLLPSVLRPVVYHGYQGTAPFQSVTARPAQAAIAWAGAYLPYLAPIVLAATLLSLVSRLWLVVPVAALFVAGLYAAAVCMGLKRRGRGSANLRVRALAGLLHVAQPFARLWGRLWGTALPPADRSARWQGERRLWLKELGWCLETTGVRVEIAGPFEAWDLRARVGALVSARVTTAVVWNWEPRHRILWHPRWPAFAWLAAVAAAFVLGPLPGALLLMAGAGLLLLEVIVLRRRLASAIARSTRGAGRGGHDHGTVDSERVVFDRRVAAVSASVPRSKNRE